MREPQSTADLRILDEMAKEILDRGTVALPGALRSLVRTERGQRVAIALEVGATELAVERREHKYAVEQLRKTIDGLRNENQTLTDELLAATAPRT
jgi:hypothetical protein